MIENPNRTVSQNNQTQTDAIQSEDIDQMELKLSKLAYQWRSKESQKLVDEYRQILCRMIQLGFTDPLSIDSELPAKYMPQEYLNLHR